MDLAIENKELKEKLKEKELELANVRRDLKETIANLTSSFSIALQNSSRTVSLLSPKRRKKGDGTSLSLPFNP